VTASDADVKVQQIGAQDAATWVAHIDDVRAALDVAIDGMRRTNERTARQQRARVASIKAQQRKLLDAFLDDSLPRDLLAEKQRALKVELDQAQTLLDLVDRDAQQIEIVLHDVLELALDLENSYTTTTQRRGASSTKASSRLSASTLMPSSRN